MINKTPVLVLQINDTYTTKFIPTTLVEEFNHLFLSARSSGQKGIYEHEYEKWILTKEG
ncbi:hypothetical protein [Adhaeribacter aquaticus]|uniref:hypothetical protein n=1 Tax=Adhaeribacter aquaticus TaxID=299567 RepID=UPI00040302D2|nr:hypothetical protein [Adhaeribacter aquaticus]